MAAFAVCLLAVLCQRGFAAYDTWHAVDVQSVICAANSSGGATAPNLAAGAVVSGCSPGVTPCSNAVTDGKKDCASAISSSPMGTSYACSTAAYVDIDLGAIHEIDEVVLYQYTCGTEAYCSHRVDVSTHLSAMDMVYNESVFSYSEPARAEGTSMRFPATNARYIRVRSSRSDQSERIPFVEVEVYMGRRPPPPPAIFTVSISPEEASMDMDAPHILTFMRASGEQASLSFNMVDADGTVMVKNTSVTLQALAAGTATTVPAGCACTGARLTDPEDIQKYGVNYGSTCGLWDNGNCGGLWPNITLGDWCCLNWCYSSPSCPDAYMSQVLPGQYFSYRACAPANSALPSTCSWTQQSAPLDPCACRNVAHIMDDRMKGLFPSNYGSTCDAWDSTNCAANYAASQLDSWCCAQWCYVDEACPHAIPSYNPGMEGKLFWSNVTCAQNAQAIAQCPYKKETLCECLQVEMPANYLKDGMPADYGKTCAPHDVHNCTEWNTGGVKTGMWCCAPWCWVNSSCPDAQASTVWPGAYWSSLSCDWNVTEVYDEAEQKCKDPARRLSEAESEIEAWSSGGGASLAAAAPLRRMGSPARRRSPTPTTSPRRRRSAAPSPAPTPTVVAPSPTPAVRPSPGVVDTSRRRAQPVATHRRRTQDLSGQAHTTPSGMPYGYTSNSQLMNNFGGRPPVQTPYGYSAPNVYPAQTRPNVAMYGAAAAAGGFAAGVGSYWLYNQMYGRSYSASFRRRRSRQPEWCQAPPESRFDLVECQQCYQEFGISRCPSASKCFAASSLGCGAPLRANFTRDDLMTSGFVPSSFTPPFRVNVWNISGAGFLAGEICPPTDSSDLANFFGRTYGLRLDLYVTLTQLEELDPTLLSSGTSCTRNTGYECKAPYVAGSTGTGPCYGNSEVCEKDGDKLVCMCQKGMCFTGTDPTTAECTAALIGRAAGRRAAASLVTLAATLSVSIAATLSVSIAPRLLC